MFEFFLSYLLVYKYIVVFFVIFTASLGLPLPATAILVAAGAFAAQGYFDIFTVLGVSALAGILGDTVGYQISDRYGRKILYRIGFKKILTSQRFTSLEKMFQRNMYSTVFFTRFLATGLGPSVNLIAGLSKTKFRSFFLTIFCGEIIYVCLFTGLGFIFGDQWESILSISQEIIGVIILIVFLGILLRLLIRSKKDLVIGNLSD